MAPSVRQFHVSAQAIAAPVLSFIALLLCIPPLIWHASNRNIAATFLTVFVILSDLFNIMNAMIWPTDDMYSWWDGSILCDIQVKLSIGIEVGMPGALVCIFRSLALVLDTENTVLVPSRAQRIREVAIELFFCAVLPVLAMVGHFVVQPNRYYIFAIAGCAISYDGSWLAIILPIIWPLVICVIAAGYCILVVIRLTKYTSEFASIVGASGSNLTTHRFIRLFCLALVMILFVLPLQSWVIYTNLVLMIPPQPYSWNTNHGPDFNVILYEPTSGVQRPDRWIPIALSVLLFIFFGLGQDAMKMYRSFFRLIGLDYLIRSLHVPRLFSNETKGWYSDLLSTASWRRSKRGSQGSNLTNQELFSEKSDSTRVDIRDKPLPSCPREHTFSIDITLVSDRDHSTV